MRKVPYNGQLYCILEIRRMAPRYVTASIKMRDYPVRLFSMVAELEAL
jgi:hypothetical protein